MYFPERQPGTSIYLHDAILLHLSGVIIIHDDN